MKKPSTKKGKGSDWKTDPYPLYKKRNKKQKPRLTQPYAAISSYLKKNGWNVVVIGGTSVEQGTMPFNFVFRCNFTGSKKVSPLNHN